MDWKRFDLLRRDVGPVELDLVEAYAQKKINRRDFVKRGSIVGLSMPFMGAIISACGSDSEGAGSDGDTTTTAGSDGGGEATVGGSMIVAVQQGDSSSGLDPVNMIDLGTYNVVSQSFEYLVGLGDDGNIAATALATGWTPNEDGSVWTFDLRPGVTWQSGEEFTSADVAATMDRLAAQGNAGLAGVIAEGAVDASDPTKAVFTLIEANGNFPVLVSLFNAQSVITPVDYTDGTTLDERSEGTGAWILDSFDPTTFVSNFSRNPNWWGGTTPLDSIELRGFADLGTAVTAMSSREIDAVQQFTVIGGEGLLNDDNFTVLTPPASTHRQVWMNTQQGGDFTNPLVRQALAYAIDRDQLVSTLFDGRAEIGNDHPVLSSLPFFDPDAVEQRTYDVEKAQSLLAEAGVENVTAVIESGDIQEIPQYAAIMQQNALAAGFDLTSNVQSNSTFYGDSWCPGDGSLPDWPCAGSSPLGIVDYGHRPVPDIFLASAHATGGVWNSSLWSNADFDQALSDYRTSVDVDGQKAAIGQIQQIMHEDTPSIYAYFYNFLSGHDDSVSGMQATALGHTILSGASKSS